MSSKIFCMFKGPRSNSGSDIPVVTSFEHAKIFRSSLSAPTRKMSLQFKKTQRKFLTSMLEVESSNWSSLLIAFMKECNSASFKIFSKNARNRYFLPFDGSCFPYIKNNFFLELHFKVRFLNIPVVLLPLERWEAQLSFINSVLWLRTL